MMIKKQIKFKNKLTNPEKFQQIMKKILMIVNLKKYLKQVLN